MIKAVMKWIVKTIVGRIVSMLVITGIVAGILFFLAQGITDASLERVELYQIKDITTESFTMSGEFIVNNPSKLPIPIKSVDYEIIIKETGEKISIGNIPASFIGIGESSIPFEQVIRWVPTAKLAAQLATKEHVYTTVRGEIIIDLPQLEEYTMPFSEEVDIKEYIRQSATGSLPDGTELPDTTIPSGSGGEEEPLPNFPGLI